MKRDEVLTILNRHQAELQRLGVKRAALFGSVARGTDTEASDIDILVDIDQAVVRALEIISEASRK